MQAAVPSEGAILLVCVSDKDKVHGGFEAYKAEHGIK